MILPEHFKHHDRLKPFIHGPMLILGHQENRHGYDWGVEWVDLDPDGGQLSWDLNTEIPWEWVGKFKTVYNLGTIEHVFDYRQALRNAARIVAPLGYYLHHGPCAGYEGHGIYVADPEMTMRFFELNGFRIAEYFFTTQDGKLCAPPVRGEGLSIILWFAAKKNEMLSCSEIPQQVFKGGVKV